MASPAGFEPASEGDDKNPGDYDCGKPLLSSLLMFDKHRNTQPEPFSLHESFTSQQRSDKSRRGQPCQKNSSLSKVHYQDSLTKNGSISPPKSPSILTPKNDSKSPTLRSPKSTPEQKNRLETAEKINNDGILRRTLNMVSSDTFKENSAYNQHNRNHSRTQQNARIKSQDGYKKMNKEPTLEKPIKIV